MSDSEQLRRTRRIGRPIGTDLVDMLKQLAEGQEDHVIAEYLSQVAAKVQQYGDEPTKDQVQSALWDAELQVVHRLSQMEDRLLTAIGEGNAAIGDLRSAVGALQGMFSELAETVSGHVITLADHERRLKDSAANRRAITRNLNKLKDRVEEIHDIDVSERAVIMQSIKRIEAYLEPFMVGGPIDREALLEEHRRNTETLRRILQHLNLPETEGTAEAAA